MNTFGNGSYYLFGNPYQTNLYAGRTQVGNPDLKWETTRQLDFGLDLAFSWRSRAIDLMRSGLPVQPCSVCLSKSRLYSETKDWSAHNHP